MQAQRAPTCFPASDSRDLLQGKSQGQGGPGAKSPPPPPPSAGQSRCSHCPTFRMCRLKIYVQTAARAHEASWDVDGARGCFGTARRPSAAAATAGAQAASYFTDDLPWDPPKIKGGSRDKRIQIENGPRFKIFVLDRSPPLTPVSCFRS